MLENDQHRQEELSFLADPLQHLGADIHAALLEIGRRVDLDYFGLDFGIDQDGKLLMFECNATMLIDLPQSHLLAYRQPFVKKIRDAMSDWIAICSGGASAAMT
jgi:hypothetical protein